MSVDFWVSHDPYNTLNLSNTNARALLAWLDLPAEDDLSGSIDAADLAARCRRRLWDEARNHDPEIPSTEDTGAGGCRVINLGREPDYLRTRTERLLRLAEEAQRLGRPVVWG